MTSSSPLLLSPSFKCCAESLGVGTLLTTGSEKAVELLLLEDKFCGTTCFTLESLLIVRLTVFVDEIFINFELVGVLLLLVL